MSSKPVPAIVSRTSAWEQELMPRLGGLEDLSLRTFEPVRDEDVCSRASLYGSDRIWCSNASPSSNLFLHTRSRLAITVGCALVRVLGRLMVQ
jgi:hypothetical protein